MKNFIKTALLSIAVCTVFNIGNNLQATENIMNFGEFRNSGKINDPNCFFQHVKGIESLKQNKDNFKYSCYVIEQCSKSIVEHSQFLSALLTGFLCNLNYVISSLDSLNVEQYADKENILNKMDEILPNDVYNLDNDAIEQICKQFKIDKIDEKIKNIIKTISDHSVRISSYLRENYL